MPTNLASAHIVLFAYETWGEQRKLFSYISPVSDHLQRLAGHQRPLIGLAARIVRARSQIYVTFITHGDIHDRVEKELARNFTAGEEDQRERLRQGSFILFVGSVISSRSVY